MGQCLDLSSRFFKTIFQASGAGKEHLVLLVERDARMPVLLGFDFGSLGTLYAPMLLVECRCLLGCSRLTNYTQETV